METPREIPDTFKFIIVSMLGSTIFWGVILNGSRVGDNPKFPTLNSAALEGFLEFFRTTIPDQEAIDVAQLVLAEECKEACVQRDQYKSSLPLEEGEWTVDEAVAYRSLTATFEEKKKAFYFMRDMLLEAYPYPKHKIRRKLRDCVNFTSA